MFGTSPFAAESALVVSSGTSYAGFHSVHPRRHTGVGESTARTNASTPSLCLGADHKPRKEDLFDSE